MVDIVIGVFAVLGSVLVVLAGVGLLRFRDVYARMHAATKATTVGIASMGVATAVAVDGGWAKVVLAVAFTFITAPTAAHLVGRAAYRAEGIDLDLEARDDLGDLLDGPHDTWREPFN